jgi:hypothetical protein
VPVSTVVSGVYKSTIVRDAEYALREKREAPIERVRILEHVRGNRWKAQWIDPNSGLVHYVESGHLLCPWKQLKAFLREESDAERLRQHNVECGWVKDSPVDQALYQVFENVGDDVSYYRGVLTSKPEPLARVKTRAGMPVDKSSPYAYTDRAGTIHIPFDEAVEIARRFCARRRLHSTLVSTVRDSRPGRNGGLAIVIRSVLPSNSVVYVKGFPSISFGFLWTSAASVRICPDNS